MRLVAVLLTGGTVFAVGAAWRGIPLGLGWRSSDRLSSVRTRHQTWLTQAGVRLTPSQFWAASAAAGLAVFVALLLLTATPAVAVVPALSVGALPRLVLARQRAQRQGDVRRAWPDGLREIITAVAAGTSLPRAVATLATTGPEPLRAAFARFPALLRTVGAVPALEVIREELADTTSDQVIEVLIVAHERGGPIVTDLLHDLAEATTRDLQALEQIATETLEQRLNARAVFVLPWLALLALTVRPGHFRAFYGSGAGLLVILLAGALSLLGMWIVGRLAAEPVDQRVFPGHAGSRDGATA